MLTVVGYYNFIIILCCLLYNLPFVLSQCNTCPVAYCPATNNCVSPNQNCSCQWKVSQCGCLLYTDSTNCTKSLSDCTWVGCLGKCIPNSPTLCLSCTDTLNILHMGIAIGVGLALAILSSIIIFLFTRRIQSVRRRMLFHVFFNLCSLGSSGLVNYCTQVLIPTQYASKITLLVCSSVELLFLIFSWFTCMALPSQTGKIERVDVLDSCSKSCVVKAYFLYYGCYLYCVGIWIYAYLELNSLLKGNLFWEIGLLVRLGPVLLLIERIGSCIYNCGAEVGGAVNPLFVKKNSYEELK